MIVRTLLSTVLLGLVACTQAATVEPETAGAATAVPGASQSAAPDGLQPSEGFDVTELVFADGDQQVPMSAYVADDRDLRTVGLMHRSELPADAGMIFVFAEPTQGAFWMRDTLLPLSIAFVGSDGTVQEILDMDPCSADPCPRYAPDEAYVHAIEANRGYFDQEGIEAGWSLEFDAGGGG